MEPTRLSRFGIQSSWIRIALVLAAAVIYALAFVLLYRVVGDAAVVLLLLPVIAAGLFLNRLQEQNRELTRVREAFHEEVARREQAEEALERAVEVAGAATQARNTFLSDMGHELRSLLTPVVGYNELLQERAEDLGYLDFIPDLEKMRTASRRLLALINDVIDLSKLEMGTLEVYLEPFSLTALMREAVTAAQPLIEKNGNVLEVYHADDLGAMYADLARVRQILLNLLNNAAKRTQQGHIVVTVLRETAADDTDWLRFSVADTGIGMTPEQVQYIFQPFTQADASTTRQYGGSGLELAICHRLCQVMGGEISVESEVGKGSTFVVYLPADRRGREAGTPPPGSAGAALDRA